MAIPNQSAQVQNVPAVQPVAVQQPQANPQTTYPGPGMQPGGQPGMPSSVLPAGAVQPMPEKKSSKWLWIIFSLGILILLGLVAYFVFVP